MCVRVFMCRSQKVSEKKAEVGDVSSLQTSDQMPGRALAELLGGKCKAIYSPDGVSPPI